MNTCRCGSSWTGLSKAHCSECHRLFSVASAFDKHRSQGRCVTPGEVGLELRGEVWGYGGDRPALVEGRESDDLTASGEGDVPEEVA